MWLIWNEVGSMCSIYGAVAYLYYKKREAIITKKERLSQVEQPLAYEVCRNYLTLNAACAAANRAIGTRNGEQLT